MVGRLCSGLSLKKTACILENHQRNVQTTHLVLLGEDWRLVGSGCEGSEREGGETGRGQEETEKLSKLSGGSTHQPKRLVCSPTRAGRGWELRLGLLQRSDPRERTGVG